MSKKQVLLLVMSVFGGIFLVVRGIGGADWLGTAWLGPKANEQWWLTPYLSVSAADAYNYFAILFMVLGGLCAGITVTMIFKRHPRIAVFMLLFTLVFTVISFNTFDYMVAYATGSTSATLTFYPMWNFNSGIVIDGWDFYVFCVVIPLFVGAMLLTLPISWLLVKSGKCQ
jgi:hypothetical protein